MVELVPKDVHPEVVTAPVVKSRKVPLVPFVFLGVGVAAAATATYFGLTSQQQVSAARTTLFQDDRSSQLRGAQTNATVANVLFAVTAVAGIGALIGFILGFSGEESP